MGISHRDDDRRAARQRAQREAEAVADARETIAQFNARLAAGKPIWAWPTIGAALATNHIWLVVACEACDTITDLDLTVKRRDPDASIRIALADVRCPRCNGHGRPRIAGVSKFAR